MTPKDTAQIIQPQAPAPAPVFGNDPTGTKPQPKGSASTFIGSAALPSQANGGWKTLLGQ